MPQVSFDEGRCVIRKKSLRGDCLLVSGGLEAVLVVLASRDHRGGTSIAPCHRAHVIVVSRRICNKGEALNARPLGHQVRQISAWLEPLSSPSRSISGIVK